jgi:hypothetical protein
MRRKGLALPRHAPTSGPGMWMLRSFRCPQPKPLRPPKRHLSLPFPLAAMPLFEEESPEGPVLLAVC